MTSGIRMRNAPLHPVLAIRSIKLKKTLSQKGRGLSPPFLDGDQLSGKLHFDRGCVSVTVDLPLHIVSM